MQVRATIVVKTGRRNKKSDAGANPDRGKVKLKHLQHNKVLEVTLFMGAVCALVGIFLLFFSSCGFISAGGVSGGARYDSQTGNPGDGDTPVLSSRLRNNPELADKECDDNNRCKEACRTMYEDSDSYKGCYNLTIEQVSDIEEVFYALVSGDTEELEDIDTDHLEDYLKLGVDGWRDKVIAKQDSLTNNNEKYERWANTLTWIVDQAKDVVPALEVEDQDNEILQEIILEYCNISPLHRCQNDGSDGSINKDDNDLPFGSCQLRLTNMPNAPTYPASHGCNDSVSNTYTCPKTQSYASYSVYHTNSGANTFLLTGGVPTASSSSSSGSGGVFSNTEHKFFYCSYSTDTDPATPNNCGSDSSSPPVPNLPCITLEYKQIFEVDEDNKKLLFSLFGAGEVFFEHSAEDRRYSAFALGHALLKQACAVNDSVSEKQCVRAFYCWVRDHSFLNSAGKTRFVNFVESNDLAEVTGDSRINLNDCAFGGSNFEDIDE